ncbi:essential MCU regulator%2C mitochondrial-like [Scomber scombrus]|uniref:Essential MCU regulator, mitochondrial n=1 Tax=Scomber scombrus TaxID=13677 RepID=A0AAV1NN64_SCOSC
MASALGSLARRLSGLTNGRCSPLCTGRTVTPCRTAVSTSSGAILPKTQEVVPFLYVGTLISKNFAALLEEHDIFVPEDDDDDD